MGTKVSRPRSSEARDTPKCGSRAGNRRFCRGPRTRHGGTGRQSHLSDCPVEPLTCTNESDTFRAWCPSCPVGVITAATPPVLQPSAEPTVKVVAAKRLPVGNRVSAV